MEITGKKQEVAIISLLSIFIGVIVGGVDTLFGRVLLALTEFREAHFLYLIPFLAPVGMFFVYVFLNYGKTCRNRCLEQTCKSCRHPDNYKLACIDTFD